MYALCNSRVCLEITLDLQVVSNNLYPSQLPVVLLSWFQTKLQKTQPWWLWAGAPPIGVASFSTAQVHEIFRFSLWFTLQLIFNCNALGVFSISQMPFSFFKVSLAAAPWQRLAQSRSDSFDPTRNISGVLDIPNPWHGPRTTNHYHPIFHKICF